MASRDIELAIGVALLNHREIAQWPLSDVKELRKRLCEAIDNVSVLQSVDRIPDKEEQPDASI